MSRCLPFPPPGYDKPPRAIADPQRERPRDREHKRDKSRDREKRKRKKDRRAHKHAGSSGGTGSSPLAENLPNGKVDHAPPPPLAQQAGVSPPREPGLKLSTSKPSQSPPADLVLPPVGSIAGDDDEASHRHAWLIRSSSMPATQPEAASATPAVAEGSASDGPLYLPDVDIYALPYFILS
eukprot:SM000356S13442  [mRNA]  locus=s356:76937:77693:- [translate_table: standard]